MSNFLNKLTLLFFFLFSTCLQPVYSQQNTQALHRADSLFQQQQYAASFALYKQIINKSHQYSPQMLLKMAFTQEAQQNYTAALYYLHLYYEMRPSRTALKKMEDIAQRQHFTGYEYNDLEFFQTQLQKYNLQILQILLVVAVGTVTIIFFIYKEKKVLPGKTFQAIYLLYLAFILFYLNFFSFGRKGIIRQNNVAIMAAPAAGANWLATASEGHRIVLKGERDIWYETEWNGQRAYIRKKNVLELPWQ